MTGGGKHGWCENQKRRETRLEERPHVRLAQLHPTEQDLGAKKVGSSRKGKAGSGGKKQVGKQNQYALNNFTGKPHRPKRTRYAHSLKGRHHASGEETVK